MQILESKSFHHNDLFLHIIHDTDFDHYTINIYHKSDRTNHCLFGYFMTFESAKAKFDTIRL